MYSLAIVDDEAAIRNGLATRIDWASLGYRVAGTFEDGEDALAFLKSHFVDVILSDIRMAVVSGLDLARVVRHRYPEIEVVLLSGYREFEYAREAMSIGVRHYLLKPTVPDEVREVFSTIRAEIDARGTSGGPPKAPAQMNHPTDVGGLQQAASTAVGPEQIIESAKQFVETHLHEELSLDRMANEFYFSPGYFSRLFSRVAGCGFQEYLTEARMVRATKLLRRRPFSGVENVATQVGLKDRRYFSKLFKGRFGMTPSVYRMRLRRGLPNNQADETENPSQ